MRTTLDIDDDVLFAAKELAAHEKSSAGRVISHLARLSLNRSEKTNSKQKFVMKDGIPTRVSRGEIITLEDIQKIMDAEGI